MSAETARRSAEKEITLDLMLRLLGIPVSGDDARVLVFCPVCWQRAFGCQHAGRLSMTCSAEYSL